MSKRKPWPFTAADVKETFAYDDHSGRLIRIKRGLGARIGREVGSLEVSGRRQVNFRGRNINTDKLVWAWHRGELPMVAIKHKNGINSDDCIDNLQLARNVTLQHRAAVGGIVKKFDELGLRNCISGLYQIRNAVNGNRYIGSSSDIERRFVGHHNQLLRGAHHSLVMQRAWNKHGENAFSFEVLMICKVDDLVFYEQRFLDALKPAYNMAPTAGSMLRFKMSDEVRAKLSDSHKGQVTWMKGKTHTDETRKKISIRRLGKGGGPRSPERLEKISAALKGRPVSAEMRARISATLTGSSTGRGLLLEGEVRRIRDLWKHGIRQCDIATYLGIAKKHVHTVVRNHGYLWVTHGI